MSCDGGGGGGGGVGGVGDRGTSGDADVNEDPGAGGEHGNDGEEEVDAGHDASAGATYVDEETFQVWLDRTEFPYGMQVQRWWTEKPADEEGVVDRLKHEDDETNVEFFRRIREALRERQEEQAQASGDGVVPPRYPCVKDGMVLLSELVGWLEHSMGPGLGLQEQAVSDELLVDEIMHELLRCGVPEGWR